MLCISAAYAVMVSATFVYCVEMATDTAIVAMDAIILIISLQYSDYTLQAPPI